MYLVVKKVIGGFMWFCSWVGGFFCYGGEGRIKNGCCVFLVLGVGSGVLFCCCFFVKFFVVILGWWVGCVVRGIKWWRSCVLVLVVFWGFVLYGGGWIKVVLFRGFWLLFRLRKDGFMGIERWVFVGFVLGWGNWCEIDGVLCLLVWGDCVWVLCLV